MSRIATLLVSTGALLALASTIAPAALAADPKQPEKSQFYIFDTTLVNGAVAGPGLSLLGGREDARFGRMLALKKDLVPAIGHAAKDPVFK